MTLTRRKWIQRITAAGLTLQCAVSATGHCSRADLVFDENKACFANDCERTYRADVVVSILGVPIFNRRAAGGGRAVLREVSQGDRKTITLQFAGGANPERTRGIHYFGSMEEVILERPAGLQAACFGFVTARPANQDTFEDARRYLLSSSSHPAGTVAVVEQLVQPGSVLNISTTLPVGEIAWREWPELMRQVRSEFRRATVTKQETTRSSETAAPFLYAVLSAVRARGSTSLDVLHNAKPYRLECEKASDRRAGANFSARNLTACPQSVVRMACQIRDLTKGRTSQFKLWLDESSELPIRIEFSPRSYLRITLELDQTLESPATEWRTHAEK